MNKKELAEVLNTADQEIAYIEKYYLGSGGPFATKWLPGSLSRVIKAYTILRLIKTDDT